MVVILGLNIVSFLVIWALHFAKAHGAKTFKWGKVLESTRERYGEEKWDIMKVQDRSSSEEVQDKQE